jgi:hypothetical protein
MKVNKCDICEATYPIPEVDTIFSITVEGVEYGDLCDQCRRKLKHHLREWLDISRIRVACKECGQ